MDDTKGLSYFFLGLGIGVAVGMIFAPQAGAETRSAIRNRATEGGEYIRRRGRELGEGATGLVERGKHIVTRQKDQLSAAVEAGKQAYRESVSSSAAEGRTETSPAEGV